MRNRRPSPTGPATLGRTDSSMPWSRTLLIHASRGAASKHIWVTMYEAWADFCASSRSAASWSRKGCPSGCPPTPITKGDRKSTRLNSSHVATSYAVFCLKKKNPDKTDDCPDALKILSYLLFYFGFSI